MHLKRNIFSFLIFFFIVGNIYATCENPKYMVNQLCLDSVTECYKTGTWFIDALTWGGQYILWDTVEKNIILKNKIKNAVDMYKSDFSWIDYTISWYCNNGDCSDLKEKKYTLSQLLSINTSFKVKNGLWVKTYIDGMNYFLRNYKDVLTFLDTEIFWNWSTHTFSLLKDISPNVIWVWINSNFIRFKNVCDDVSCQTTSPSDVDILDTSTHVLLEWIKKELILSDYIQHSYDTSFFSVDSSLIQAWSWVTVSFSFNDILPKSESWCLSKKYRYKIYKKYDDDVAPILELDQVFNVTTLSGTVIWTLDNLWFVTTTLNNNSLSVHVTEPLWLTKSWNVYFYVEVSDETEWYTLPQEIISYSPVEVIHTNPVLSNSYITSSHDLSQNYYPFDSFDFYITLKDVYGNIVKDWVKWLDIIYEDNPNYKLSKSDIINYNTWILSWLKNIGTNEFHFKFQPTQTNNYKKQFKIRYYKKDTLGNPTSDYLTFTLFDNAYEGNIFVDSLWTNNDFPIACTNKNILLAVTCTSDNLSGCNSSADQQKLITGDESGGLTIKDNAWNQKSYSYNIQHIDKTIPSINIPWYSLEGVYNIYATDLIHVDFSDTTAPACLWESYINYKVYNKNNPAEIYYTWSSQPWTLSANLTLDILKDIGNKDLVIETSDKYGNNKSANISFKIVPNLVDLTMSLLELLTPNGSKFANSTDSHLYRITFKDLYWNPISGKEIISVNQDCSWDTSCKTLKTDMVDMSWDDALTTFNYSGTSSILGQKNFSLRSFAPWEFSQRFSFEIPKWNTSYVNISDTQSVTLSLPDLNAFKKTFKGQLQVSTNTWATWDWILELWTTLMYRLLISPLSSIWAYNIEDFYSSITSWNLNHSISEKSNPINLTSNPIFDANINTSESATSIDKNMKVVLSPNPVITYKLWWKDIRFRLTESEIDFSDLNPISITWSSDFLWVKVIWNIQGSWKQEITGQISNFSDISQSTIRSIIRKNAFQYTQSMTTNQTLNWVKYVEWDITISWNQPYETLVVKNGNVIINWNLNPTKKKLWIIVLKDAYNTKTDYIKKWNVYITPLVTEINALFYADGWLISSKINGDVYDVDSSERTASLRKQLILNGSLFTKNTIGWSIFSGGNYKLPWWEITNSFNNAMIYDLNYVRRGKESCIPNFLWNCKYDDAAFIIIYDSQYQKSPPKLFSN